MILLFVRGRFTDHQSEDEYNRSLYRLLNEETNQTLDQSLIKEALGQQIDEVRIDDSDAE